MYTGRIFSTTIPRVRSSAMNAIDPKVAGAKPIAVAIETSGTLFRSEFIIPKSRIAYSPIFNQNLLRKYMLTPSCKMLFINVYPIII